MLEVRNSLSLFPSPRFFPRPLLCGVLGVWPKSVLLLHARTQNGKSAL